MSMVRNLALIAVVAVSLQAAPAMLRMVIDTTDLASTPAKAATPATVRTPTPPSTDEAHVASSDVDNRAIERQRMQQVMVVAQQSLPAPPLPSITQQAIPEASVPSDTGQPVNQVLHDVPFLSRFPAEKTEKPGPQGMLAAVITTRSHTQDGWDVNTPSVMPAASVQACLEQARLFRRQHLDVVTVACVDPGANVWATCDRNGDDLRCHKFDSPITPDKLPK